MPNAFVCPSSPNIVLRVGLVTPLADDSPKSPQNKTKQNKTKNKKQKNKNKTKQNKTKQKRPMRSFFKAT